MIDNTNTLVQYENPQIRKLEEENNKLKIENQRLKRQLKQRKRPKRPKASDNEDFKIRTEKQQKSENSIRIYWNNIYLLSCRPKFKTDIQRHFADMMEDGESLNFVKLQLKLINDKLNFFDDQRKTLEDF